MELLEVSKPVYQPPYRASHRKTDFEKSQVGIMREADVIENSKAEWASRIVVVLKNDGKLRFGVDYWKLNVATRRYSHPIRRIDEFILSLEEAQILKTVGCSSFQRQLEVEEPDRDKTKLTSYLVLSHFKPMPFGLQNPLATFPRAVGIILSRVKSRLALVYLDDVVVYSDTFQERKAPFKTVPNLLRNADVTLFVERCAFFKPSVDYLGYIIRRENLEVAKAMCSAVQKAQPPTTQTEFRSFFGSLQCVQKVRLELRTGRPAPKEGFTEGPAGTDIPFNRG